MPTVEEFNPRIGELNAGDIGGAIRGRRHGIFPDQAESVGRMSNDELLRFRSDDPISGDIQGDGFSITGGHHRLNEIIGRVGAGTLPSDARSRFCSMIDNEQELSIAIRDGLQKFELDTGDPKWSSHALDRLLEEVMSLPGGSIRDVYLGLDHALKRHSVELTNTVAALIKDVVVRCFSRYRQSYESTNWKELVDGLASEMSEARLYLALHAIPPKFVGSRLADAIAQGLGSTAFRDEAANAVAI